MVTKNKNIEYYLNLPWTYTVEVDKDKSNQEISIVSVNELPGVMTNAPTTEEAMELIKEAMVGAFKLYLKHGEEIPEPLKAIVKIYLWLSEYSARLLPLDGGI